jgi:hypothetical protein
MTFAVGQFTTIPRSSKTTSKISSQITTPKSQSTPAAMPSQSRHSDAASAYSVDTAYSYEKAPASQPSHSKSKGSWRQRVKKSLKEVGYPPTYHYDLEHGIKRPEYAVYGTSSFAQQSPSRI